MLTRHIGDRSKIGDAHERVGRALDENRLGTRSNCVLELVGLGGVDHAVRDAKVVEDLIEHAVRAAIHVGGNDDLVALVEERENCGDGSHATAKGKAGDAALEVCDEALERRTGGVARTGVLPARDGAPHLHLPVRRGLVDGDVHRARRWVRGGSGVDEASREVLSDRTRWRHGAEGYGILVGPVVLCRHGSSPIRVARRAYPTLRAQIWPSRTRPQ